MSRPTSTRSSQRLHPPCATVRSDENQREGTEDTAREANVTAVDLLILVPWLVFAAGLVAIGLRLLIIRRDRRRQ